MALHGDATPPKGVGLVQSKPREEEVAVGSNAGKETREAKAEELLRKQGEETKKYRETRAKVLSRGRQRHKWRTVECKELQRELQYC